MYSHRDPQAQIWQGAPLGGAGERVPWTEGASPLT